MTTQATRNLSILKRYHAGDMVKHIALDWGISSVRVSEIVKPYRRQRRPGPGRPPKIP